VEANHSKQSKWKQTTLIKAQGLRKQSSLPLGANGLSNLQKQTTQQETILAIDSGAIGRASAWRKVRNSLKLNPTNHLFGTAPFCGLGGVCIFSLLQSRPRSQDQRNNNHLLHPKDSKTITTEEGEAIMSFLTTPRREAAEPSDPFDTSIKHLLEKVFKENNHDGPVALALKEA